MATGSHTSLISDRLADCFRPVRTCTCVAAYALAASILCGIWTPVLLRANPTGENVTAGQGSFNRNGSTLTVLQNTDRMVVNWQQFSINPWETTRFVQPGVNSAALNRVVGGDPSQILGNLQANGNVFLINPNGIVVGGGARIDAGGFLASTLDLSDAQFMAGGTMNFLGPSTASVKNLGVINASNGDVVLIGQEVINHGEINAPNGMAGLGAGNDIVLKPSGAGIDDGSRLTVRVKESELGVRRGDKGVSNTGRINAATAELKAAGGNVYALAINNTGVIRSTSLQNRGGRIFLGTDGGKIANYGTLQAKGGRVVVNSASRNRTRTAGSPGSKGSTLQAGVIDVSNRDAGQKGGAAQVLGDQVLLGRNSKIDASGSAGGGTILAGGDFQGSNVDVVNAQIAFIDAGAELHADAVDYGNGGKIIVWSDKTTVIHDSVLSAQGGPGGGNGGFIETSGKQDLLFQPREVSVSARSAGGKDGIILLDPDNIYIETYYYNDDSFLSGGTALFNDYPYYFPPGDFTFSPGTVSALTGNVVLQARDSIYVNEGLLFTSAESVTFQAGNSILVNADIAAANARLVFITNSAMPDPPIYSSFYASESFSAFSVITGPPPPSNTLFVAPGVTVSSNTGDISLNSLFFDIQGQVRATDGTLYVGRFPGDRSSLAMQVGDSGLTADMVARLSSGGQIVFGKALMETAPESGVYAFTTASTLTAAAPLVLSSPTLFVATGNILLNSMTAENFTATAGGSITQGAGTVLTGKNVTLTAGGQIVLAGNSARSLTVTAASDITQLAGTTLNAPTIALKSTGGAVVLANVTASELLINAATSISQVSDSSLQAETLRLLAGGAVTLDNLGNALVEIVEVRYGSSASIYSAAPTTLLSGNVTGAGAFTLIGAGNLTLGTDATFTISGDSHGSSVPVISLAALGNLTIENAQALLNISGAVFNLYSSTEAGASIDGLSLTNGLNFVVYNNQLVLNPARPAGNGIFFGSAAPPPPSTPDEPDAPLPDFTRVYAEFLAGQAWQLEDSLPDTTLRGKVYILLPDGRGGFTRYEVVAGAGESYLISDMGIYKVSNEALLEATRGALSSQMEQLLKGYIGDTSGKLP